MIESIANVDKPSESFNARKDFLYSSWFTKQIVFTPDIFFAIPQATMFASSSAVQAMKTSA